MGVFFPNMAGLVTISGNFASTKITDMKYRLLIALFIPVGLLSQKQEKFILKGSFKNVPADIDQVYISYTSGDERKTDSVEMRNGKYRFSGFVGEPTYAQLRVSYHPGEDGKARAISYSRDVAAVFLEKGRIRVSSGDSLADRRVKGSSAHAGYEKILKLKKPFDEKMEDLSASYYKYRNAKDQAGMDKVLKEIEALSDETKDKVYARYALSNPRSPVALYAVNQFAGWDIKPDKTEELFNQLPSDIQQWPSAVKLKERIEIAKKTAIGTVAMDFTQNDTLDIPVTLSSFRGKYVLVDFWASWCGPCRVENPNVVKAFNKYREKGFHILSVSLDRPGQKEKWIKAIHDDGLTWTHVSDLKYWNNEVAVQYGIRAIPQNLLLNPEGRIIAKNLRGEELDQKLEEFMVDGKKAF